MKIDLKIFFMLKTRNLIYLFVLMLVTVSSCNMLEKDNLTNEDIVSGLKKPSKLEQKQHVPIYTKKTVIMPTP